MLPGSVALVDSNDTVLRTGDLFYPYRQNSDFFYLTGISQQESVFVLSRGGKQNEDREALFIKKPTSKSKLWTGQGLSFEKAFHHSGIEQVKWLDDLDSFLKKIIQNASTVYSGGRGYREKIDEEYPDLPQSPLSPLMTQLRMVKEEEEIEEIKKASHITQSAFLRVLRMMEPGIWEYEVEAEIIAEFLGKGAEGHAYEPIIASGRNAMILHYVQNNNQCCEGDLLLMDFGAEVNNYAADCSRTIPVNGHFTPRQKEVYDAVLRIFKRAKAMMLPGILLNDFHNQVGTLSEEEHIKLGLYRRDDAAGMTKEDPLWKKYFMHGTSHSLGLDVHDPFNRDQPFQPGMVLTCEPAIYIPEEGIGIRLENDVLITVDGPVDMMADIPIESADIEELMQSGS